MFGELQGFVGTQGERIYIFISTKNNLIFDPILLAFMAPEVFMHTMTEGHGRAADIWSVGCVVIEMATGKVIQINESVWKTHKMSSFAYYRGLGMNSNQITLLCSKLGWEKYLLRHLRSVKRAKRFYLIFSNMIRNKEKAQLICLNTIF